MSNKLKLFFMISLMSVSRVVAMDTAHEDLTPSTTMSRSTITAPVVESTVPADLVLKYEDLTSSTTMSRSTITAPVVPSLASLTTTPHGEPCLHTDPDSGAVSLAPSSVDHEKLQRALPVSLRNSTELYRTTVTSPTVLSTVAMTPVSKMAQIGHKTLSPQERAFVEQYNIQSTVSFLYTEEFLHQNGKTFSDLVGNKIQ